jgi:hypothetical protein
MDEDFLSNFQYMLVSGSEASQNSKQLTSGT